jgi:hypothetical protein
LLLAQQQELLSNQSFDKQPHRREHKAQRSLNLRKNHIKESGQMGLHPDDDQDCTISHLMQALPPRQATKQVSTAHIDHFMVLNENYEDIEKLQQCSSEEFDEDMDDLIEDRNTP